MKPDKRRACIQQYRKDCRPFGEDDFQDGYKNYRVKALTNQEYLQGRKSSFTREVWTGAFRAFKDLYFVNFVDHQDTYNRLRKGLLDQSKCAIDLSYHNCEDEKSRSAAAPVGDALFEIGIESLAEADVGICSLMIYCAMTSQSIWENITGWEKLDLCNLHSFVFSPWLSSHTSWDEDGTKLREGEGVRAVWAADAIAAVMKKSQDSLESFAYGPYASMVRPDTQVIPLPSLRELDMEEGMLQLENLGRVRLLAWPFFFLSMLIRYWRY